MKFRILAVSFALSWLGSMFALDLLERRMASDLPAQAQVQNSSPAEKLLPAIEESEDYQAAAEGDEEETDDSTIPPAEETRPAREEWGNYWFPFRVDPAAEGREE